MLFFIAAKHIDISSDYNFSAALCILAGGKCIKLGLPGKLILC